MLWFSLGASLDEEELLSNLATKVGKFGGSSWIGVVTPLLSNFCFLKLFYREAQGLFVWFLVNFICQPVHSSHLVVICELHLSLRFLSGFGASFSFLAAF